MMTAAEFEAIPIMGEIVTEIREVDGKRIAYPSHTPVYVLWNEPGEPMYVYYRMSKWRVGKHQGRMYRSCEESYWVGEDVLEPRPA